SAAEYRRRPREGSGGDGAGHAACAGGRTAGVSRGKNRQEALRHGEQSVRWGDQLYSGGISLDAEKTSQAACEEAQAKVPCHGPAPLATNMEVVRKICRRSQRIRSIHGRRSSQR